MSTSPPAESERPSHFTAAELGLDPTRLSASEAEAEARFGEWRHRDPFPEIDPALLNSADLFDYVATTGMVHPFEIDSTMVDKTLKPASCGIRIGGPCLYWTSSFPSGPDKRETQKHELTVGSDGVLTLPPNSIVYATLAPTFRMPDYIAARFNLSIGYVYRGLLVGTGPLVDPGFTGRLQIPLHNLTSTPCHIPATDIVLWMEFTKLSSHPDWSGLPEGGLRYGRYVSFPPRKQRARLEDYLEHANGGKPIVSSIPDATARASGSAAKASEAAERAARGAKWIRVASLVAAIVGAITLLAFVHDLQTSASSDADTALQRSNQLERELIQVQARLKRVEQQGPAETVPGTTP